MHIEAVRKDASPSRTGLVQNYMKIECPQCWVACHLYHDGLQMKLLRGYFLRANWEILKTLQEIVVALEAAAPRSK